MINLVARMMVQYEQMGDVIAMDVAVVMIA
jgi:hypothetical protein